MPGVGTEPEWPLHLSRNIGLTLMVSLATALAACWVIGGLWLIFDFSRAIPVARWVVVIAGVGAIAVGEFVFLVGAADSLFPRVARRMWAWALELALFGVFTVCCTLVALVLIWSVIP